MSLAVIQKQIRLDRAKVPGNRPFLLKPRGRAKGRVLMLHGFTASPYELRELGGHLKGKGYLVYAPRLAGHGMGRGAFDRAGRHDWLADANRALEDFSEGKPVHVIGHSGGAVQATILAAQKPHLFKRLVLGAPAYKLVDWRTPFSVFALVRLLVPEVKVAMPQPDAAKHWVLNYSSHRVAELVRAGRRASKAAEQVRCPVLLLHSRRDNVTSSSYSGRVFERMPASPKWRRNYDTDEHNVFHHYNPFQKQVFGWVAKFLAGKDPF